MDKWLGAPFWGSLHPAGAQHKTLISNTAMEFKFANFLDLFIDRKCLIKLEPLIQL